MSEMWKFVCRQFATFEFLKSKSYLFIFALIVNIYASVTLIELNHPRNKITVNYINVDKIQYATITKFKSF